MTPPSLLGRCALALVALLALGALSAPATAAPADCDDPTGGFAVLGPPTVYGFVGTPLAPAPFSSTSAGTVTWRGDCVALPDGIGFDPATQSYTGTPTVAGTELVIQLADDGADSALGSANLEILPASALDVTVTDTDDAPLDAAALTRGAAFRLHGAGLPGGSFVTATLGGTVLDDDETTDGGSFALDARVPLDAAAGAHRVDVELVLPSGQRYATAVTLTVRVLALSGPAALTPVAGSAADYAFTAHDAIGPVRYSLVGQLPAGLALDSATGRLHGRATAAAPARALTLVATDGHATAELAVTLTVLGAQTIVPAITAPAAANPALDARLAELADQGSTDVAAFVAAVRAAITEGTMSVVYAPDGTPGFGFTPSGGAAPSTDASGSIVVGTDYAALALRAEEEARRAQAAAEAADLTSNLVYQSFAQRSTNTMFLLGVLDTANDPATYADVLAEIQAEQARALRDLALKLQQDVLSTQNQIIQRANIYVVELLEPVAEPAPLPAGTEVFVEMHSTPVLLARTTVGATGAYALSVAPPANLTPGRHHLVVTYRFPDGSRHTTSLPVDVAGLPATGAQRPAWALTAALLAVLGGLALVATRRRWDAGAC